MQRLMIVFNRQQEIGPVALRDRAQGLLIGMQSIEHDDFPVQWTEVFKQGARGGDFVALLLHQFAAQRAAAGEADGPD